MKKYVCIRQHDITDCGAACLATVARHHKLKVSISEIREIAGTDKMGTNALGMVKAAEQLGFYAKAVKGNAEALATEFPLPAIAHIIVDGSLQHFVVIHKITAESVMVADPAHGIVEYSFQEFLNVWTGALILLTPAPSFSSEDKTDNYLLRFFKLLLPQKRILFFTLLASIFITAFGIVGAFYFRIIMDTIVPGALYSTLTTVSIGLLLLYVFKAFVEYFRRQLTLYLSQKLDIPLVLGSYHHVMNLPMSFFGTRRVGEIVSRFTDAAKIRDVISGTALTVMIDVLMGVVGAIVLYIQNAKLFMIALIMVMLYAVIVFSFNRPIRNINEKQMENNAQVTSYLVESLTGVETIKASSVENVVREKTDKLFVRFLKSVFKGGFLENLQSTSTSAIAAIGGVIILWLGTLDVLAGTMTLGELITFNALLVYFIDPIKNLINLQPQLQMATVASNRLGEILSLTTEQEREGTDKLCPSSIKGDIKVRNLSFRYGTRHLVLDDVSMDIPQGSRVALVGESGSGKTTLVSLLLRLYDWEKGEITLGSYNLKDIQLETLRSKASYVTQEPFFFSGTIKDNLTFGLAEYTIDEMTSICEQTGVADFVNRLPSRYETMLEENAANLSGGQRQKLAIARALLRKPELLILDEATSHLDAQSERVVHSVLETISSDVSIVLIAHRLSTIMHCDYIYVMKEGKIIEAGTHQELLEKQEHYYDFWAKQMPWK